MLIKLMLFICILHIKYIDINILVCEYIELFVINFP